MNSRLAAAAVAMVLTAGAVTGCSSPANPPEPTPVFTNEDDAFAAAEATYRAYVDALNHVDLSDPATFEDVYAWTTGDFNSNERKTLSQMHADGWAVSGQTLVARIDDLEGREPFETVALGACADVSSVELTDASGASKVAPSRPDVQSTRVSLVAADESPTGFLVADIVGYELEPPCQV